MAKNTPRQRQSDFSFPNKPTERKTMSRSNPTDNAPNPCTRWMEWNGSHGCPRYYDKQEKKEVQLDPDFTFILLDQTATIRGWHDPSDSGIFANEVRDTRVSPFIVKAFKGGKLAEGLYSSIKDRVNASGGRFTMNCYLGFKGEVGGLRLGCLQFKGASLNAWVEFTKENRAEIYKGAIHINGYNEAKKGKVVFRVPVFELVALSEDTNRQAVALDIELQDYFNGYFKRTHVDQSEAPQTDAPETEPAATTEAAAPPEDDVPF